MSEIKCPHCGTVFTVDESDYATIVRQVRDAEFHREVEARERAAREAAELEREVAVSRATAEVSRERDALAAKLAAEQAMARERIERVQAEAEAREAKARSEREQQASELHAKMSEELAAKDALIKFQEEEVARLRDMRSRLSTKLVGESLEQHCLSEFNKIRTTAFPGAYFEKDNDASGGTKGDFIYREEASDGVELLSIMFEMKTEEEGSAARSRKTNEHFLAKLDSDRAKKGCEYAVLVSMLEPESELYNQGIVDMSWRYPKMYVIRPQFFIPLISLLRNAALSAAEARRELAEIRQQNVDVTNFEEALGKFQADFGRNWASAQRNYDAAIDEIDKSIKNLERVKKSLETSRNQFRLADDKVERLTIRRLTRKNPTMRALLDEAREARERAEADAAGEPVEPDGVE